MLREICFQKNPFAIFAIRIRRLDLVLEDRRWEEVSKFSKCQHILSFLLHYGGSLIFLICARDLLAENLHCVIGQKTNSSFASPAWQRLPGRPKRPGLSPAQKFSARSENSMASEIFGNAKPVYKAKKIMKNLLIEWQMHGAFCGKDITSNNGITLAHRDKAGRLFATYLLHVHRYIILWSLWSYGLHESCIVSEVFTITRKIVKPATRVASKLLNLTEITFLTRVT